MLIPDLFGPPPVEDEDDDIFGSKGKFVSKGLFDDDEDEEVNPIPEPTFPLSEFTCIK